VNAPGCQVLFAEIEFDPATDLDLQLLDPAGAVLATSESLEGHERVEVVPPVDQDLGVRVYNARGTFSLSLRAEAP
jgi:hypothetical protein